MHFVAPRWGIGNLFLSPTVGHLQLFQNKIKMPNMLGGGGGGGGGAIFKLGID